MSHDHASSNSAEDCKISMMWNWYTIDACFLSPDWHITNRGSFAATCVGVVLLVVLLEALRRAGREFDDWIARGFPAAAEVAETCPAAERGAAARAVTFRASPLQQFVRAVLHAATFGVAYIVMLLAMYYNGYIIMCILIGAGLGKFLCDWMTRTVVIGDRDGKARGIEEPTVCCG